MNGVELQTSPTSARELLDELPGELNVARGGVRVIAGFTAGKLNRPVRIGAFRIPGRAVDTIRGGSRRIRTELLEQLAGELQLDQGETEIVIEYVERDGKLTLHWIDYWWEQPGEAA